MNNYSYNLMKETRKNSFDKIGLLKINHSVNVRFEIKLIN